MVGALLSSCPRPGGRKGPFARPSVLPGALPGDDFDGDGRAQISAGKKRRALLQRA